MKAPVGLLLVRGSQPVGMSTGRTAAKIENPNLFSIGEGFGFFVFFGKQNAAVALDVTMAQRSELDYLIYNDPLGYADLILNGDPEEYLKNVTGSHGLEI